MNTLNGFTKEYLLERLTYDADKGLLLRKDVSEFKKCNRTYPIGYKWKNKECYINFRINGKPLRVHQVIYFLETGETPEFLDHIDRDRHNNHISNLRPVNRAENRLNSNLKGYKVIQRDNGQLSYAVRIFNKGLKKEFHVGSYRNETIAKFAAWWLRELMYPGIVEPPKFSKDEENALLRLLENYNPL